MKKTSSAKNKTAVKDVDAISKNLLSAIKSRKKVTLSRRFTNQHVNKLAGAIDSLVDSAKKALATKEESSVVSEKIAKFNRDTIHALACSSSFESLIKKFMKSICETLDFAISHYYEYDAVKNCLVSSKIWHQRSKKDFNKFRKLTEKTKFERGSGLPGTAWKTKKLTIYQDFYKHKNSPRAKASKNLTITGGFAIPLFQQDLILGVIECYDEKPLRLTSAEKTLFKSISEAVAEFYAIYQNQQNYQLILNATAEGIYGLDLAGRATFFNPMGCKMLGYKAKELIGQSIHELIHHSYADGSNYPKKDCLLHKTLKDGKPRHSSDEVLWTKDGTPLPIEYHSTPIVQNGKRIGAVVTFFDITKEIKHKHRIENMAHYDQLTGLYNRSSFETKFKNLIDEYNKNGGKFALLLVDFNKFKQINDAHGHDAGDLVLQSFAKRLKGAIKSRDIISRLGNDEFIIILNDIASYKNAKEVAERIFTLSKKSYDLEQTKITGGVSIGITTYPKSGKTYDELMKRVDLALQKSKTSTKIEFYSEDFETEFLEKVALESTIKEAVENKEFILHYQPQVDLTSGKIRGFEALLRWNGPNKQKNDISPATFIPIVERVGLADKINAFVVKEALTAFKKIKLKNKLHLAINISPAVVNLEAHIKDLIKIVKAVLKGDTMLQVGLELTESNFMETEVNTDHNLKSAIQELKKHSIRLDIDDFGVRYSSINRILEYEFDAIKIDMSFVQKLDAKDNKTAVAIIETILFLAKRLNFTVIAEGVETEKQAKMLKEMNCPIAQGYYYHKPMPLEEVKKLL